MEEYRVSGRYDIWRGAWRLVRSTLPGLSIEAPTREKFTAEVEHACSDHAGGRDHRVSVTMKAKTIWIIEPRFGKHLLMNGKIVTRERMEEAKAKYEAAIS